MTNKDAGCEWKQCGRKLYRASKCWSHYTRSISGGDMDVPIRKFKSNTWSDWGTDKNGYVIRWKSHAGKTTIQMQHRAIMSDKLGRPLLKHENVHHINGIKHDNRPENLELWTRHQPTGARVQDKLAWSVEMVEEYLQDNWDQELADRLAEVLRQGPMGQAPAQVRRELSD